MKNSIQLVSFEDSHLPELYRIFSDQQERRNILPHRQHLTFSQFEATFKRHVETKYTEFKIIRDQNHDFVGFLIAYDYMRNDGHMKFTLYIKPALRSGLYGIFAGAKFVDYLFRYYNIHKVFTEVFAFNQPSINIHNKLELYKEACLKDYKFYDGKYYDMYIYSMTRDFFYDLVERKRLL